MAVQLLCLRLSDHNFTPLAPGRGTLAASARARRRRGSRRVRGGRARDDPGGAGAGAVGRLRWSPHQREAGDRDPRRGCRRPAAGRRARAARSWATGPSPRGGVRVGGKSSRTPSRLAARSRLERGRGDDRCRRLPAASFEREGYRPGGGGSLCPGDTSNRRRRSRERRGRAGRARRQRLRRRLARSGGLGGRWSIRVLEAGEELAARPATGTPPTARSSRSGTRWRSSSRPTPHCLRTPPSARAADWR